MWTRILAASIGFFLLVPPVPAAEVAKLLDRLLGEFATQAADGDSAQHAVHAEIRSAALDGRVIYMQWRQAGDEGELTRQRLWTVTDEADGIVLRFFRFRDHRPFVDMHTKPIVVMAMRMEDLLAAPEGCAMRMTEVDGRLVGSVSAEDCRLGGELVGRELSLEFSLSLDADGFDFHEAAREADGSLVYRMPESGSYRFVRR